MRTLSVAQPWASLAARGVCRFLAREWADTYRGTVAIHATDMVDADAIDRLSTDTEFAERLAAAGLHSSVDIDALPRSAIVGAAVIADLWSLESLEEVATEDDAILLGDVVATAVFWELAEAVATEVIPHAPNAAQHDDASDEVSENAADVGSDDADDDGDADAVDEADDEERVGDDEAEELSEEAALATAARDLEPLDDELATRVRAAVEAAGARFDSDDLVFWPVQPSASLAALIGDDALGDREITQRVWAYVVEQDLQDPEDHTFVYLDDTLRAALESDADGVPTIEFTDLIVAQMVRVT